MYEVVKLIMHNIFTINNFLLYTTISCRPTWYIVVMPKIIISFICVGGFCSKLCGSVICSSVLMLVLIPKFAKTSLSVMLVSTDLYCGYA